MSAPTQEATAHGVVWDLSRLFSSIDDPKIETAWSGLHARADAFAATYRGKIESGSLSPQGLSQAIQSLEEITRDASKPASFCTSSPTSLMVRGGSMRQR